MKHTDDWLSTDNSMEIFALSNITQKSRTQIVPPPPVYYIWVLF
jgi:hypothetical protein